MQSKDPYEASRPLVPQGILTCNPYT
jgi:hypothetical protein